MEIEVPKGTRAVELLSSRNKAFTFDKEGMNESEIVLGRGTSFKVSSFTPGSGGNPAVIRARVVNQPTDFAEGVYAYRDFDKSSVIKNKPKRDLYYIWRSSDIKRS